MDINSLLGTVMSGDSVQGLSQAADVSDENTRSVLSAALPLLLNGALSQANNSETSEGFANALSQHAAADTSNIGSFFNGIDLGDGAKIVAHLLGANTNNTVNQVAQQTGVSQQQTSSILSAAAPLLMSLLGQATNQQQSANAGLGIGNIMGSLLGGGNLNLGGMLSGLLGGGASGASDTLQEVSGNDAQNNQQGGGLLGGLLNLLK